MSDRVAAPENGNGDGAGWQRRVIDRSLDDAKRRSIDRGSRLIRAAAKVLDKNHGESLTVQEVADEAGQSLRTLYQYFASKDDLLLAVYEEAMRTYADLLMAAVAPFTLPLERLASGVITAGRMPSLHGSGRDRGLSQLRLQLSQAKPALVASAQQPVTSFFQGLIEDCVAAGELTDIDVATATYFVCSLRNAYNTSITLGNDLGLQLPGVVEFSAFCLAGFGAVRPREWHVRVDERLRLADENGRFILRRLSQGPAARRAKRRSPG